MYRRRLSVPLRTLTAFLAVTIIGYGAITFHTSIKLPSWSAVSGWECVGVLGVVIIGLFICSWPAAAENDIDRTRRRRGGRR